MYLSVVVDLTRATSQEGDTSDEDDMPLITKRKSNFKRLRMELSDESGDEVVMGNTIQPATKLAGIKEICIGSQPTEPDDDDILLSSLKKRKLVAQKANQPTGSRPTPACSPLDLTAPKSRGSPNKKGACEPPELKTPTKNTITPVMMAAPKKQAKGSTTIAVGQAEPAAELVVSPRAPVSSNAAGNDASPMKLRNGRVLKSKKF